MGKPAKPSVCKAAPAPVRDIRLEGFYSDGNSSIVDPAAYARYQAASKPFNTLTAGLAAMSDAYVRAKPADGAAASCALDWLHGWAVGDGLLGDVTNQGGYERKWSLATIALAYLKIREAPGLASERKQAVEAWIGRLAGKVVADYDTKKGKDSENNHVYWAALAVGAAAIVGNDGSLFDWAVAKYRFALTQIQADGTLPLEVARKSKARHYHVFSLEPLIMLAEMGAANGLDLYGEAGGALHRLAARVIESLDDPRHFERLTGAKQDWTGGKFGGHMIVWAEPYYARFKDPRLVAWISRFRPLSHSGIGGDATHAFGVKALP